MKTFYIPIAFFFIIITGLVACTSGVGEIKNDVAVAKKVEKVQKLPTFDMFDANGNKVNLASFQGKKVFVNLWASWCPPCIREIPSIEKLYRVADKEKAVFVLLSLDENFEAARGFANSNKLQVPVFYPAEQLPGMFNVESIPATYLFDEQGTLIKQINGMDDYSTREYIELFK